MIFLAKVFVFSSLSSEMNLVVPVLELSQSDFVVGLLRPTSMMLISSDRARPATSYIWFLFE